MSWCPQFQLRHSQLLFVGCPLDRVSLSRPGFFASAWADNVLYDELFWLFGCALLHLRTEFGVALVGRGVAEEH
jgi:hypothetical protein